MAAAGDNADPFARDPIIGNDVFIGDSTSDRMDGEGGDDIMVGNRRWRGDRYVGSSGFDWAVFKDDPFGVTIDLQLRAFDETPVPRVERRGRCPVRQRGRSVGIGTSATCCAGMMTTRRPIAVSGFTGSVLTNSPSSRACRSSSGVGVTSFGAGNIILGGEGSDIIEGRGGDDLIDGDAWLNVRIGVSRENLDGTGAQIDSFDSMEPLVPLMVSGFYNPGQLQIVREILPGDAVAVDNFDTVFFSGNLADYTSGSMPTGQWATRGTILSPSPTTSGWTAATASPMSSACSSPISPSCWCPASMMSRSGS